MKFREYIDKLKNATLTKEEEEFVKEEIDKHEVIAEYIYEQEEEEFSKASVLETNIDEVKKVNRHVNKKILTKIIGFFLIIIILGLTVNFSMNKIYYNPNEGYPANGNGRFFIDASVFTELHFPGYGVEYAEAKPTGFGTYEIRVTNSNWFNGKEETYRDRIIRGKNERMGNIEKNFWKFVYGYAFREATPDMRKYDRDVVKELPRSSQVSVYFGFKNSITLEEFKQIQEKYTAIGYDYVAVETGKKHVYGWGYDTAITGFKPNGGISAEKSKVSEDEYPNFTISDTKDRVKVWNQHFKTLLEYMSERPEFLSAMGNARGINKEFYKDALKYVDKNGVKVYGVLVVGKVYDILEFERQSNISNMSATNAKLVNFSD